MKRVFPSREIVELPIEHEIFQCVFPIEEKPQVPNPRTAVEGAPHGITWERWDAQTPHYRGIYDDEGRLMVVICHNTDLGDGWEDAHVHDVPEDTRQAALRMGANIVGYALTR